LHDNPRLAAARAGNDQERAFTMFDGLYLFGVQLERGTHQPIISRSLAGKQAKEMRSLSAEQAVKPQVVPQRARLNLDKPAGKLAAAGSQ
jgi:hypothetical protein